MRPHPTLVWSTLCLGIGIVIGDTFPGVFYLFVAVVLLLMAGVCWRCRWLTPLLLAAVWVCVGAARSNVSLPPAERWMDALGLRAAVVNEALVNRLRQAGASPEATMLCGAMALGNKTGLTAETRQAFALTGGSHLLALSGMHLGILYGLLYVCFIQRLPFEWRRWADYLVTLPVLWAFTFVAGMAPSLVRAATMLSCCVLAFRARHPAQTLHRLSLCAMLMWLLSPSYVRQLGFWLSLLAVYFITEFFNNWHACQRQRLRFTQRRSGIRGLPDKVLQLAIISCMAQLGTTPLSIYHFHTLPLLGVLWSVVLVPLTAVVIYATIVALLLPLAWVISCLNLLAHGYLILIRLMAAVPHCVVHNLHPTVSQVALLYALLLCIVLIAHISLGKGWTERQ
ncbi:MAG: ComEC/Rec2 family competence protein [Bacteroidaceae bacterium]|nr:ComEC/Rec2 family competence protein [Bacteroidaceae bacterium]